MRSLVRWVLFLVPFITISCRSVSNIQNDLQSIRSELYYELESPVYKGDNDKSILLYPIDDSKMELLTSVKRTKRFVLPLLVYNLYSEKYEVNLGESTFSNSYTEFLTEALLIECNNSSSFHLVTRSEDLDISPDYKLYIEIQQNTTTAELKLNESHLFLPVDEYYYNFPSYSVPKVSSQLLVNLRLTDEDRIVYEHNFPININNQFKKDSYEELYLVNEKCVEKMTESLSESTQQLVEDICSALSLFILAQ